MRKKLLDYIVCPRCSSFFELRIDEQDGVHILEGVLRCSNCDTVYPIQEGIPVFLDEHEGDTKNKKTAERFGHEWDTFDFIHTERYTKQFLDWIVPVQQEFFKGKIILDAGCGKGRHCVVSSTFQAEEIIGVDLASGSVNSAFRNTKEFQNVHIIQADLYNLPFKDETFDYIYSVGVLHHTPDPKRTFTCLVQKLKRGTVISAWVYGREGNWWIVHLLNPIRTYITSKLPLAVVKGIAFLLSVILQCALKLIYIPVNTIKILQPFSRILFYNEYMYYISKFPFIENYSIVFDHLLPEIAHYITRNEFSTWFEENHLRHVCISRVNNNSWSGKGQKG